MNGNVRIENLDFNEFPDRARRLEDLGKDLASIMKDIYKEVNELHNFWYGKRYKELTILFGNVKPSLDEMLKLVGADIPDKLRIIANNYAMADHSDMVAQVGGTKVELLEEVVEFNDTTFRFLQKEIEGKRENIMQLKSKMHAKFEEVNKFYTELNQIWQSDAYETFKSKLTELQKLIDNTLEQIFDAEFTRLMNQTISDMQDAESKNTMQ